MDQESLKRRAIRPTSLVCLLRGKHKRLQPLRTLTPERTTGGDVRRRTHHTDLRHRPLGTKTLAQGCSRHAHIRTLTTLAIDIPLVRSTLLEAAALVAVDHANGGTTRTSRSSPVVSSGSRMSRSLRLTPRHDTAVRPCSVLTIHTLSWWMPSSRLGSLTIHSCW